MQFWMFASPVAYPSSLVPLRWRWLYGLNPMAGVIDGFRWAITGRGQAPSLILLASSAVVALILLGGLFFFNRMESSLPARLSPQHAQSLRPHPGPGRHPRHCHRADPDVAFFCD